MAGYSDAVTSTIFWINEREVGVVYPPINTSHVVSFGGKISAPVCNRAAGANELRLRNSAAAIFI